ncbi:MAG: dipeptidase PepE [Candidatus Rokubacteria bacterium]|nr:dipeptidase PepE [Candidatus Rokubacteria bacterium]
MRLLLLGNSGRPFLGWCRPIIGDFLRGAKTLAFVSAANLYAVDAYWQRVCEALEPVPPGGLGVTVTHCDWRGPWREPLARADAIFVGGGNTYALLQRLTQSGLRDAIGERVRAGTPYIGSSAGSNVAGPTILTTNDWNVVGLSDFTALGLVPFNVNPHYLETDPAMAAHSETRDDRIAEYHVANANVVLGIEEGTGVRVEDAATTVVGNGRVKLFRRGAPPRWFGSGDTIPV